MSIDQHRALEQKLIEEIPFCAIDFETTQLPNSTKELAIIEIGAQRFLGNELTAAPFQTLVNPQCSIRPFDTSVSGITNEMVVDKPRFLAVSESFFSYIKDCVIIAHNASFDKRALESQCIRDDCNSPHNLYIDSAALLRKIAKLQSYSLESAAKYFAIEQSSFHRAVADSQLLIKVFWQITKLLKNLNGIRYFRDLCQLIGVKNSTMAIQGTLFD